MGNMSTGDIYEVSTGTTDEADVLTNFYKYQLKGIVLLGTALTLFALPFILVELLGTSIPVWVFALSILGFTPLHYSFKY